MCSSDLLAVVAAPLQRWFGRRLRWSTLATALTLATILAGVVLPLLLVAEEVGRHAIELARDLETQSAARQFQDFVAQHPQLQTLAETARRNLDSDQIVEKSVSTLAARMAPLLGQSISAVFQLAVLLFLLFFLLRDGPQIAAFARSLLPLTDEESGFLFARLRASINALVLGRFLIAVLQGAVAGALYAALGVGGWALLGVATTVCAMIPAVGAIVIWLPVAIYLALVHAWLQAIILAAVGALVISTLDNFLYPIFVGSRMRLHTAPIFLSMLGGVWLFGVVGLVLGPLVFNTASVLALIWRSRMRGLPLTGEE